MVPAPSWSSPIPGYLPCPLGWPCFYCPSAVHGVSWGSGPHWAPAGGRAEGVACPEWLPPHPRMLQPGSPVVPSRPCQGRDALACGTGNTGHTGIAGQTPGTGSCVSFSRACVTFSTPSITHSAQLDGPHSPSAQTPLAAAAAAKEVSGKPQITFSAGKRCAQAPPASGGPSGVWYYKASSSILSL